MNKTNGNGNRHTKGPDGKAWFRIRGNKTTWQQLEKRVGTIQYRTDEIFETAFCAANIDEITDDASDAVADMITRRCGAHGTRAAALDSLMSHAAKHCRIYPRGDMTTSDCITDIVTTAKAEATSSTLDNEDQLVPVVATGAVDSVARRCNASFDTARSYRSGDHYIDGEASLRSAIGKNRLCLNAGLFDPKTPYGHTINQYCRQDEGQRFENVLRAAKKAGFDDDHAVCLARESNART